MRVLAFLFIDNFLHMYEMCLDHFGALSSFPDSITTFSSQKHVLFS